MSTPSPVEILKLGSRQLRGPLAEELARPEVPFGADASQLLKFHGMYPQKDRDKVPGLPPQAQPPKPQVIMARGRIPGGRLTAEQWLAWDAIADRHGDGTLRITTRQALELHGVAKGDVKAALQALRDALLSTKGACGDVVRNVVEPPNPWGRPDLARLDAAADLLARHFEARSSAYAEVFLDGEPAGSTKDEAEPIYGATYLPRKFKIGLTVAGENAVDLYTHDLGLAATFERGELTGWFVFAGGGMGMTHNDPATFPRLADLLGWVPADALLRVAEALVAVHRDYGDRSNRRRARLKYVLAERGADWARATVEALAGVAFEDRPLPPWRTPSHLGWIRRLDGRWALGFHTLSGRVADTPGRPLKSALAEAVRRHRPAVQLTPEQDLVLVGLDEAAKADLQAFLAALGIDPASPSALHDRALACVALPYCGLAIAEAERALPAMLEAVGGALARHGLEDRAPVFRVVGCANGCARPYAAELALVGQTSSAYALFAGGHPEGTRLASRVAEKVTLAALPELLDRLFGAWAREGAPGEGFGDFAHRLGAEALSARLAAAEALP